MPRDATNMPIAAMSSNVSWNLAHRRHKIQIPIANRNIVFLFFFLKEKHAEKNTNEMQSDLQFA